MKKETAEKLEAVIASCAGKATETEDAVKALQFTQSALNASQVLIGLYRESRESGQ